MDATGSAPIPALRSDNRLLVSNQYFGPSQNLLQPTSFWVRADWRRSDLNAQDRAELGLETCIGLHEKAGRGLRR